MESAIDYAWLETAHPEAGRYDSVHGDEDLVEDLTQADRAADYRVSLIHDMGEMADLAADLQDSGALARLMTISQADPEMAGLLLASITGDLVERKADEIAENDSGELREFPFCASTQVYELFVEQCRTEIKGGAK